MNNYTNMNYIPNDFNYYGQLPNQMNNYFNQSQMYDNNYINGWNKNMKKESMANSDMYLMKKLSKQSGDNMNFNKPLYIQNSKPNDLYDAYNGFIKGNMFPDLYNTYKLSKPYEIEPMNEQAELLTYIDAYCFAAHDLNLYLDTHPNDRDMINLFEKYTKEYEKYTKEYESKYGPIRVSESKNYPWSWNNSPWPWENM